MHRSIVIATLIAFSCASVSAQYLKYRDPKTPRNADGTPNMTAPAPRLADGKPDLGGLWNATDGRFLTNLSQRAGIDPGFTPWAAELFKERQENEGRDRPAGRCLPHTIPNAMLVPNYPWKVVQTPGLTVILFENFTDFRQIFSDGRDFPEEREPTWFGYSLVTWEGDTFVVNRLGFNDKAWLDDGNLPTSELIDPTRVVIDADDVVTVVGEPGPRDEAHVTSSNDCQAHRGAR